jgi:hypothetical protein
MTNLFIPIFDSFDHGSRRPVAVMNGLFNWANMFKKILPPASKGIDAVLRNTCFDPFTFRINGEQVIPVGPGVSVRSDSAACFVEPCVS